MMRPLFEPMSIIREPSSVITLLLPRTPLTLYPPVLLAPPPLLTLSRSRASGATTPGRMRSSSMGLRLMIERLSIWSARMTPSRAPVSVWMISREAVTSTVSVCWPTWSVTSNPFVSLALIRMPLFSAFLNPGISMRTV